MIEPTLPASDGSLATGRLVLVHLLASHFVGGPEQLILGLARKLTSECRSVFATFPGNGKCRSFLCEAERQGFESHELRFDMPNLVASTREVATYLSGVNADVICCNGYKADILGGIAARAAGVPAIAVSHGWTGESRKVRLYEWLDKRAHRKMGAVACVSEAQALRVRNVGVPPERIAVVRNAIDPGRFTFRGEPPDREALLALFPVRPQLVVAGVGRLSPEKGFSDLVEAAKIVLDRHPSTGIAIFGDGPLRARLQSEIHAAGLERHVLLAGFRHDISALLPCVDLMVLPSHTEGLPTVVLEAFACGRPVVATAVGGTPEVVRDGVNGLLVEPRDPHGLAHAIGRLLADGSTRACMGKAGRQIVLGEFTFDSQAARFLSLIRRLIQGDPGIRCRKSADRKAVES